MTFTTKTTNTTFEKINDTTTNANYNSYYYFSPYDEEKMHYKMNFMKTTIIPTIIQKNIYIEITR